MHSLILVEYARADAAERRRVAHGRRLRPHRSEPPPIRRRVAHVAARVASRLDHDAARRAVA